MQETTVPTMPLPPAQSMPIRNETMPLAACTIVGMGHAKQGMPLQRHALCQMPPTLPVTTEQMNRCQVLLSMSSQSVKDAP